MDNVKTNKSEVFQMRVQPQLVERLKAAAKDDGISASSLATQFIVHGLKAREATDDVR